MSTATAEIAARIRALNSDGKADLIRSLIAELDGPADTDVESAWVKEAQRRHQEVVEGKVQPVPGEQVFANLRERLKLLTEHRHSDPRWLDALETEIARGKVRRRAEKRAPNQKQRP